MSARCHPRLIALLVVSVLVLSACDGADGDGEADGAAEAPETLTFAGPPECEERSTCFEGLQSVYGLDDLAFESIQESSARIAALEAGDVELILLFSTDAVLGAGGLTVLDDPENIVPPENVVPVLNEQVVEAHGEEVVDLLDEVSAQLTTEALIELNTASGEGIAPEEIAVDWLEDIGFSAEEAADPGEEDIVVASFNFPESVILAEIYAHVLEDAGFPVDRQLDLGARELIFPELAAGNLHLLPEYLGSAIAVGFGEDAPADVEEGVEVLGDAFEEDGVRVLEPAPAENANVFVTSEEFAQTHGLSSLADLAEL